MHVEDLIRPPSELGLDPDRLTLAERLIKQGVTDGFYPAATYAILRHGYIACHGAMGQPQPDNAPQLQTQFDTIFDMASLTKPFTATLLLIAVEHGLIHLNQPVKDLLPVRELMPHTGDSPVGAVPIRMLATHTSGLPPWRPLYEAKAPTPVGEILSLPLEAEPGTRYAYSDLGYILIGEILHRLYGKPLDVLLQEHIARPLGMTRTGYRPDAALHPHIAATRHCPWRGPEKILIGEVHDANAWKLHGIAGHAGIFSNVPDMIRFALALRQPSTASQLGIRPVIRTMARKLAEQNQVDPTVGGHSIGWFTPPNGMLPRGDLLSIRSFGHTGFTGTSLLFDLETDLTLLLLTNRVYSNADGTGVLRLRRMLANVVAGAVR
jgi:CubicO group peptidase (beta-lactamase class C family)